MYYNGYIFTVHIHVDPENPDWNTAKHGRKCSLCNFTCAEHEEQDLKLQSTRSLRASTAIRYSAVAA